MRPRHLLLASAVAPFVVFSAQQSPTVPTCEQVFKEIKVMNGVPASDMIPAMDQIGTDRGMTSPEPWNRWGDLRP